MSRQPSSFTPVAILAGGIIGAGMFSLPFVFGAVGFSFGLFYLAAAATSYVLIHLMYADIILSTEGQHRFVGYTRHYLGAWAGALSIATAVLQALIVLSIYLILANTFLAALSPSTFTGSIFFWLLGSVAIFLGLRQLAASEAVITAAMFFIIAALFGYSLHQAHPFPASSSPLSNLLLPLPIILFALSGRVAIPAVINYFRSGKTAPHRHTITRAIALGTLIPAAVYGLFIYAVLTLSPQVSNDSISGLIPYIPGPLSVLIVGLGLLSLWSSYILVGLDVRDTLHYDLHISKILRVLIVVGAPLLLSIVGSAAFLSLVAFTGGVLLSFEGLLIVCMWLKLKRRSLLHLRSASRGLVALFLLALFAAALWAVIAS